MKNGMLIGTVVLVMGGAVAFAQQPPPAKPMAGGQGDTKTMNDTKATGDHHFVMDAANGGLAEVELGRLAAEKAGKDDVKKFGQRMVDDHGKANDELKTLAQSKQITLPAAPDAKHKATIDRLSKLTGDAFDRAYVQEMLKDHEKDVAAFRAESRSGKDPEVKAWAGKTLPTLEEHLKMIQDLNRGAVGTSGTKKPQ
jgi:putative membrane protein